MAELPKDTGIERSAFFIFEATMNRASEEKGAAMAEIEKKTCKGRGDACFRRVVSDLRRDGEVDK